MKKERVYKDKTLAILLTQNEFKLLHEKHKASTFRYFADYVRALIFHTPVVTTVRSRSLDEFLPIAGGIHEELARVRRDLTRAVKNLCERPPDADITEALRELRATQVLTNQHIDDIRQTITKFYDDARQV